jgi:hypothetical protein
VDDQNSVNDFLRRIGAIESGNRYQVVHPVMEGGIHSGTQAVGRYGIMPATVAELMRRKKAEDQASIYHSDEDKDVDLDTNLPLDMVSNSIPGSKEYKDNANMMADQLRENPQGQEALARYMAKRLLEQSGGDQDRAAYQWNTGHNLHPSQITPKMLDDSQYVRKFRILNKKDNPDVPQLEEESEEKDE